MYQSDLELEDSFAQVASQDAFLQLPASRIAEELRPYADGALAGSYVCLHFNPASLRHGVSSDSLSAEVISQILVMKLGSIDHNWILPGHLVVSPAEVRSDLAQHVAEAEHKRIAMQGANPGTGVRYGYAPFIGPLDRLIFRPDGATALPFAPGVRSISPLPKGIE